MNEQTDEQTDRQINRQTDRQTDRQRYRTGIDVNLWIDCLVQTDKSLWADRKTGTDGY